MKSHTIKLRVRFAETDGMGVVYHGRYFEYFEAARVRLLDEVGMPYTKLVELGYHLPVVEAQVRYRAPAKFDDDLEITATVAPIEGPRLNLSYKVTCRGDLLTEGKTVHAFINKNGFPVRPPQEFLDVINKKS